MPDVTLTIDGQTVTVPAGTNVVDAAREAGVAIPVFCYHPKMKPVGMCRMCLVEVYTPKVDPATRQVVMGEDGKPVLALMMNKLQTGCTTPVSDGMVVKTTSERVEQTQRGVLEFLLTSHPLDCPVCDKGGECPLQNLTMEWGPGVSRFDYSDKVHFQKPIALGDLIYLDRERCILCSRCVRFQDEIADDPVLGFDNRGRAWEIISKSQPPFDSKYSGNTTDICPVGALTSADFRFKSRVWEVRSVPTICNHCPVGCNLSTDMRLDSLMRVMPRENEFVNEIWTCDKGRYGQRYFTDEGRLTQPLIRRNGTLVPATWEEAFQFIAERMGHVQREHGAAAIGGIAGAKLANEDFYVFGKLFHDVIGSPNMDYRTGTTAEPTHHDDNARTVGVGSGTNLTKLGKGTAVVVFGADPEEEAPLYMLRLRGIAQRGGDLTVINAMPTKLDRSATRTVRIAPGSEAQMAMALFRALGDEKALGGELSNRVRDTSALLQAMRSTNVAQTAQAAGTSEDVVRAVARAIIGAENVIIVYGQQTLLAGPAATNVLGAIAVFTGKAGKANNGIISLDRSNSRGALDMGVRPAAGGKNANQMWIGVAEGNVKAMYVAGANPAADPRVAGVLGQLELLVVQDLFLTPTAEQAHVVLPVAAPQEREGTYTNAERRVQRSRQARAALNDLPADWEVFRNVASALRDSGVSVPVATPVQKAAKGQPRPTTAVAVATPASEWDYVVSSDVADEISRTVAGYGQTAYTSLEMTRKSWGRQPNESVYYDGTSYENSEGVGVQVASVAEDARSNFQLPFTAPGQPAAADSAYPLTAIAAIRLYAGGEWARGSRLQKRLVPAHVILSVADAARLGINIADRVQVTSALGSIEVRAQIDRSVAEGTVIVPESAELASAAILGGARTRVTISKAE